MNQKLKPTKKTKKTDKTTSSAQNEKKKGGQKTQTKPNKKKPKKPRKVHVHDEEGEEESVGDCHDEEVSSDDDTKKKKDKTKKKTPPEKRNNQFSLAQAQKLSKKVNKRPSSSSSNIKTEAKKASLPINPVPKVRARGKTSPKTEKKKQDEPPAASSSRLKEGKERHRITSRAYHQTFDSLKPKIKDRFTKGSKEWDEAMEHAKSKAREAGREAGKSFDLENPKEKKDKKNAPDETEEADDGIPDVS